MPFPRIIRRLRLWARGRRFADELDEELDFHLAMEARWHEARGLPAPEARRRAEREFGGVARYRDEIRDARGLTMLDDIARDLRFALRALARTPGFFATTVLTLALGIGAATALFSVVSGILLRPLAYPEPDRLVQVWQLNASGIETNFSDPNFADLRAQSRSFAALAQVRDWGVVPVIGGREPVRARVAPVSADFFTAIGVRPVLGRAFRPEEQREGGTPAVVVSDRFWRGWLGASPAALGKVLTFQGSAFTIVGVMPPTADFPAGTDLWFPRELDPPLPSRTAQNWEVVGRLRDGVTLDQARADASTIARRIKQQAGDATWMVDVALVPLREQLVGHTQGPLLLLLGASGVLLLIAGANVVNLLLARAASRRGELALRLALGAGRGRLARQFVAESLVLSLGGGALGIALAAIGVRTLRALAPENLPRVGEVGVDPVVLLFALALSVVTAAAMGLMTAWRGTHGDVRAAMADSQRTLSGAGGSQHIRAALVVAQVAMALVLLVGASLLGRSFQRLLEVRPGFRTARTVVLDLTLPSPQGEGGRREMVRVVDDILGAMRAIPGVTRVGATNVFPLAGGSWGNGTFLIMRNRAEEFDRTRVEQYYRDTTRTGEAEFRLANEGYFSAMGIPVVRGRLFEARDTPEGEHVAVISESLVKARWPNEDPIGKVIQFGNMDGDVTPFTIVGVVGDVRESSLAAEPRPTFYANYRQRPSRGGTLFVAMETAADPAPVIAAARRAVRAIRPDVPPRFRTIETVVADSIADRRFILLLVGVFGTAALVLATLGVYGVISYLVTQREREIGIRVALGAQSRDVLGLVVRQGTTLAVVGVAIGAATALALTRLVSGFLYGIGATDPLSFAAAIIVLVGVAAAASYLPARRAARVDPMRVMRGS